MTTDGAGRNAVKVDTEHGKVTMHGTLVDSQAVKDKAEATVRAVGRRDGRPQPAAGRQAVQPGVGEGRRQRT